LLYLWEVAITTDDATESFSDEGFLEYRASNASAAHTRSAAASGLWFDALAFVFDTNFSGRVRIATKRPCAA
jgi:hypothetical protein